MKRKLEGEVVILPRQNGFVDVFTGTGWEDHRVFQVNKGHIRLVSGSGLSEEQFREVRKTCS